MYLGQTLQTFTVVAFLYLAHKISGISQAIIAANAINSISHSDLVYTDTKQQIQQVIPPHNMGLKLRAAPVTNVGMA